MGFLERCRQRKKDQNAVSRAADAPERSVQQGPRNGVVAGVGLSGNALVFVTRLHAEHPPQWVTFTGTVLQSVTGLESDEYLADPTNQEVWSLDAYLARFPEVTTFARTARPGQSAVFIDDSGTYTIADD